ncbi:MAG: tetratricopeptide repeat protein [Bradymonadia bacterium]
MSKNIIYVALLGGIVIHGCANKTATDRQTDEAAAKQEDHPCGTKTAEACLAAASAEWEPGGGPTEKAELLLGGACHRGSEEACVILGQHWVAEERGDTGFMLLARSCLDRSMASACRWAGEVSHSGLGVEKNHEAALGYFNKACKLGDQAGCFQTGAYAMTGLGDAPRDPEWGLKTMVAACKAGHEKGCGILKKQGVDIETFNLDVGQEPAETIKVKKVGIEWELTPSISGVATINKITCDKPFRDKRMCHVTMDFKRGFRAALVLVTTYDGDGVETQQMNMRVPKKAGKSKSRVRLGMDTKKVVLRLD